MGTPTILNDGKKSHRSGMNFQCGVICETPVFLEICGIVFIFFVLWASSKRLLFKTIEYTNVQMISILLMLASNVRFGKIFRKFEIG